MRARGICRFRSSSLDSPHPLRDSCFAMSPFKNAYPHIPHGGWDILKWKLGMTHVEKHDEHDEGLPRQEAFDPTPPEENEIIVTWIGHASFLVQLGNFALLIDPVYATHCAPLPLPSLRRLQAPGVAWDDLPPIDAILITHNHYDHLDQGVVKKLANRAHFIVPDGLEKWMRKKQVQQVTPVAWWQQVTLCNEIKITSCPAQHFSARSPFDRNQSH